jgi:hypothetical protein
MRHGDDSRSSEDTMSPTTRDIAEFVLLGLNHQVLSLDAVSAWTDEILMSDSEPPRRAIELSTADLNEAIHWLKEVPGVTSDDLPVKLLLGLVRRRWKEGRLSAAQVSGIGFRLGTGGLLPQPEDKGDWGSVLWCEYEEFDQGYRSEAEIKASVNEKLAIYEDYEKYLPHWVE